MADIFAAETTTGKLAVEDLIPYIIGIYMHM